MRRTASRAQTKLPITLMRSMRSSRATLIRSTRACMSTTPALLTSAVAAELGVDLLEHRDHLRLVADVGLHR